MRNAGASTRCLPMLCSVISKIARGPSCSSTVPIGRGRLIFVSRMSTGS